MAFSQLDYFTWKATAPADETATKAQVKCVEWVAKAATAGDECIITDSNGKVFFHSVADGANFSFIKYYDEVINGFIISTLGSGVVYITIE